MLVSLVGGNNAFKGMPRKGFHQFVKSAYPDHVAGPVVELALRVLTRAAASCNASEKAREIIPDSSERRLESIVMTHERLTAGSPGAASMDPSLRWGDGGW